MDPNFSWLLGDAFDVNLNWSPIDFQNKQLFRILEIFMIWNFVCFWLHINNRGIHPHYRQIQIVDKNRLQFNAFSNYIQIFLAKIANSWLKRSAISKKKIFDFWQYYAVKMPIIDFGWLNLPIEVENLQKSHIQIPCTCSAKIEAGYISEFKRLLAPWICNFCQKFLLRITKFIPLKAIFVNNLNLAIVRITLCYIYSKSSEK